MYEWVRRMRVKVRITALRWLLDGEGHGRVWTSRSIQWLLRRWWGLSMIISRLWQCFKLVLWHVKSPTKWPLSRKGLPIRGSSTLTKYLPKIRNPYLPRHWHLKQTHSDICVCGVTGETPSFSSSELLYPNQFRNTYAFSSCISFILSQAHGYIALCAFTDTFLGLSGGINKISYWDDPEEKFLKHLLAESFATTGILSLAIQSLELQPQSQLEKHTGYTYLWGCIQNFPETNHNS